MQVIVLNLRDGDGNSKDEAHKYMLDSSAYVSNFTKSGSDVLKILPSSGYSPSLFVVS